MSMPLRVLMIEDDEDDAEVMLRELRRAHYEPQCSRVMDSAAMAAALTNQQWDLVLADHSLPHFSATAALAMMKEHHLDIPFIIVSGQMGEDLAAKAMHLGAHDYVSKSKLERLIPTVNRELRTAQLRHAHRRTEEDLKAYHVQLEKLVEQRTAELNRLNKKLLAEVVKCQAKEKDLESAKAELEQKVAARTAELKSSNQELQAELARGRQAADDLKAAHMKLDHLVSVNPAVIYSARVGGQWPTTFVSQNIATLFGYAPRDLIEAPNFWLSHVHPHDVSHLQAELAKLQCNGLHTIEYRLLHRDGIYRWVRNAAKLVCDENGKPLECVGTLMDITEQRRLQQQLLQAQKMESIGRLVGGIAHDFNNMLQTVLGFSELLAAQLGTHDPRRRDVAEIEKAARRGATLTRQLLAFSRQQMMQPAPMSINLLVEGMIRMFRPLIGENITLNMDLDASVPQAKIDAAQIEQCIMNLVLNARDAMPDGGKLTLSTSTVAFQRNDVDSMPDAREGAFVCLSVSDTGIGMKADVQERAFEPFFTTKHPSEGAGLGLATVYGIVKQHDGWVHVYSEEGQGSTLRIYLPALPEEAGYPASNNLAAAQAAGPSGNGERILLVEDDAAVNECTAVILRDAGYNVTLALNAADAMQAFESDTSQFDLIVSDIVLPGLNGLDMAKRLLGLNSRLKVLLTSGYSDHRARWPEIRELGFRFLPKPYPTMTLLKAVREVLEANTPGAAKDKPAAAPSPFLNAPAPAAPMTP